MQVNYIVLTRCEYNGKAVEQIKHYCEEWISVGVNIVQQEKQNTKYTIAAYICSYLAETMIMAHNMLIRRYYWLWQDPILQCQKHTDKLTKAPGFFAVHMDVHSLYKIEM